MKKTKRDLEFIYEVGALRFLQRNWKQFLNADFQNISEHTFRVIWIALILAKHENVNSHEKIIKMALVHDLSESRTGDAHYVGDLYVKRFEDKAVEDIFKNTSLGKEYSDLWKEYDEKKCIEAKIVKDADTLDVDFEIQEQQAKGHRYREIYHTIRQKVYKKLYTKSAKKLWREILTSNPHSWHLNAKNIFDK